MLLTITPKAVDHTCLKDLTMLIYNAVSSHGCSRHMNGNKSFLIDYQEIDGEFVAFGGSPKGGKINGKGKIRTGKLDFKDVYFVKELKFNLFSILQICDKKNSVLFTKTECLVPSPDFKLLDESQVLLKVPRQNNMYSFDLKNVVPSGAMNVSPIPTTRIHKEHPKDQIIGDINLATQTRRMTKISEEHVMMDVKSAFLYGTIKEEVSVCQPPGLEDPWFPNKVYKKDKGDILLLQVYVDDIIFGFTKKSLCTEFEVTPKVSYLHVVKRIFRYLKGQPKLGLWYPRDSPFDLESFYDSDYAGASLGRKSTPGDLPNGKRAIGTKWVFRNKKDERGIVVRNKARLMAQGYTQEEGIDYDKILAPVAMIEAIRLFFAYASFMGFIVYQMDVKSAFLYGTIEEEVAWYETLSTYLLENGFRRGTIDKTLFIKKDKGDILLVHVYVDDIIFGSTKKSLCTEFKGLMHKKFQMSSMGELTFFLGLQVMQRDDGIFISQDKYVADILKKFDFSSVKTASTPIETNKALLKDEEAEDVDVHLYRSMIGSLMYLTASRPDIMFAVCACARFQVTPKVSHLHAVKRIFRYLKGQPKLGLWYPRDSPFDLEAFSDSDYAGASLDRKSTTGGCQFLGKRLISWQCKKQTIVANSTTEAEYVAAANCYGISDEFRVKTGSCKVNAARQDLVLLGEKPKKVIHTLADPSWVEAMQEELLQFRLQKVWTLVDLPNGKRAIGTKWVFRNKKDERGIVVRNKARLVAQGYTQEEGIDYDKVFAPVAMIEAIRFDAQEVPDEFYEETHFLRMVAMKIASTLIETNKALLKDKEAEDVDVSLIIDQMIGSLMYLIASRPDIMFVVCACARFQVTPKVSHLHAVKRIFRYLKGQPKLGL
ncbi:putative ribonuclease H-like domain-containing protein [Tanacetum coccineum]